MSGLGREEGLGYLSDDSLHAVGRPEEKGQCGDAITGQQQHVSCPSSGFRRRRRDRHPNLSSCECRRIVDPISDLTSTHLSSTEPPVKEK